MDDRLADAGDFAQLALRRAQHLGKAAETVQQCLGNRLGVPAGHRLEEDQLEQLVISQRRGTTVTKALLQALTVPVEVRLFPKLDR